MAKLSKTGGGPGTNQYKVRGQAKAADHLVHGYPPDQVIERGECIWLRTGVDDAWCLKHRQLTPELRQLIDLPICVTRLTPTLQWELARCRPLHEVAPVLGQLDAWVRLQVAKMAPTESLQWASLDPDPQVRRVAAKRMPPDQLQWAATDADWRVRKAAARRMPPDQLSWAAKDQAPIVHRVAAKRVPPDQLQWAAQDEHWEVRRVAVRRMPVDQLDWAIDDPEEEVREAAWWRGAHPAPKSLRPTTPEMRWIGPR
jgi:hypothetical protein